MKAKKKSNLLIALWVILFIVFAALFCWLVFFEIPKTKTDEESEEMFLSGAAVVQNEDKVGANIWLKQTIHGIDGITYRYVIETDCPQWDFETRYVTTIPIEWIDETSAVEVIIYDTQIRYEGSVYGSGQYYTIPLLGGISSENITLEEWKNNLIKQAYQTYKSEQNASLSLQWGRWFRALMLVLLFAAMCETGKKFFDEISSRFGNKAKANKDVSEPDDKNK